MLAKIGYSGCSTGEVMMALCNLPAGVVVEELETQADDVDPRLVVASDELSPCAFAAGFDDLTVDDPDEEDLGTGNIELFKRFIFF